MTLHAQDKELEERIAERRAKLTANLVRLVAAKQSGPHVKAIEDALAQLATALDDDALSRWLDGTRFLIEAEAPKKGDHPWRRKAFRFSRKPRAASN